MEECTHPPRGAMAVETEVRYSYYEDSMVSLLIYPEDSDYKYSLSDPPSAYPTLEPVPPSKKPTKWATSEPNSGALSEPSAPTREY